MITFITPCAPEHQKYLPECTASVAAQTIKCEQVIGIDAERIGTGFIRNRLLEHVETPYVSFLDADDWIEPTYAEKMLGAMRAGYYCYCDWLEDGKHIHAPNKAWCAGTWHTVTAVIPTALVKTIGGFDESLPALEDTDFFLKLMSRNICGIRVTEPLMHYRKGGGRAKAVHESGQVIELRKTINARYGAIKMGCCGDLTVRMETIGVQQPGDVLAQALWGGNRSEHGRATGRQYPRMAYPKTTWVSPRDIDAAPSLWREVVEPSGDLWDNYKVDGSGVDGLTDELIARGQLKEDAPVIPPPEPTNPKPDISRVKRLAKANMK